MPGAARSAATSGRASLYLPSLTICSATMTWSRYDAPQPVFSSERRRDWRYQARAYAGLRQFRVAGFSPSIEYTYMKVDSNYDLYRSDRHRFQFKLARYF